MRLACDRFGQRSYVANTRHVVPAARVAALPNLGPTKGEKRGAKPLWLIMSDECSQRSAPFVRAFPRAIFQG